MPESEHTTSPLSSHYTIEHFTNPEVWMVRDADGNLAARCPNEAQAKMFAASYDLLKSCRELRESLAAAFRAMNGHPSVIDRFELEYAMLNIPKGVGVRARAAIDKAEGN